MSAVTGLVGAVAAVVVLVLWWFTDALVVPDQSQRALMTAWRLSMIALAVVAAGGLWFARRSDRDARPLMVCGYLAATAISYRLFADIGGPGSPWIHASCLVPLASLGLLVRPLPRVLVVVAASVTCWVAYYAPHPEYLADPYAWNVAVMLVTSATFSVGLGHHLYDLSRSNFEQRRELLRLASVDPLTGVANRRALLDRLAAEAWRARRYKQPLCVLMLDLDRFKAINDTYGHGRGDLVLRQTTERLGACLRESDLLGRLGGEEFAVLLPQTGLSGAREVAERLREAVGSAPFDLDGLSLPVTVSVGVAEHRPGLEPAEGSLARADEAMYRAKREGRNRVVPASETVPAEEPEGMAPSGARRVDMP